MRLEEALLKKSRPKFGSKRYNLLRDALWAGNRGPGGVAFAKCEFCKRILLNPQSILIHQGGHCQAKRNEQITTTVGRKDTESITGDQ